jgi:hypothetical protein
LTKKDIEEFLNNEDLFLRPRQGKLSLPILQRIHHKMKLEVPFASIQVDGDLIVNGHHRYICSEILKSNLEQINWMRPEGATALAWRDVVIEEIDFDQPEEILQHNLNDARISGLDQKLFIAPTTEEMD